MKMAVNKRRVDRRPELRTRQSQKGLTDSHDMQLIHYLTDIYRNMCVCVCVCVCKIHFWKMFRDIWTNVCKIVTRKSVNISLCMLLISRLSLHLLLLHKIFWKH